MPRHRSWNQSRCLVTGATSGLGRVLAEHLVRAGASVVLTGRSADRLCAVAQRLIEEGANPARLVTISADLTVQDDCQRLFDEVAGRLAHSTCWLTAPGSERTASLRRTIPRCCSRSSRSTCSRWPTFAAERFLY